MKAREWNRRLLAAISGCMALAAVAGLAVASAAGTSAQASGGHGEDKIIKFPAGGPPLGDTETCFWGMPGTKWTRNIAWPDTHVAYWASQNTIPAGGKIVLHGKFPHSRFFSLTSGAVFGAIVRDVVYDDQMKPDRGSTNPFLPGANRDAKKRWWTLNLVDEPAPTDPEDRAPRTLYVGTPGSTPGENRFQLLTRNYLPDRGLDFNGGVDLPKWTYVGPDGTRLTGQAACDALQTAGGIDQGININPIIFPKDMVDALYALSPKETHPAVDPAVWYRFFGPARLQEPFYAGTAKADLIPSLPIADTVYGVNLANAYVYTWLDRTFGPRDDGHNIAVLKGKMPTTPATYRGESKQPRKQLRYWSICGNEGLTSGKVVSCLADEEIPINRKRRYTIAIGLSEDRPDNARAACGVGWMRWQRSGDGYGRERSNLVFLRNLVTGRVRFPEAAQNVIEPGTEKAIMKDYLPTVTYSSASRFESRGC